MVEVAVTVAVSEVNDVCPLSVVEEGVAAEAKKVVTLVIFPCKIV